jgi:hypothetical protein
MSHFSSSPRRQAIVVHHAGIPYSDTHAASDDCYVPGDHFYDFCIARDGSIYDVQSWMQSMGGHAFQANCATIGVMMQGCYGGCPYGNLLGVGFSDGQLCGLAWISLHVAMGTNNEYNHISHNKAASWKPCPCYQGCCGLSPCDCACATACCGTDMQGATSSGWTSFGLNQVNRMFWMRNNLANGYNCLGTCPC